MCKKPRILRALRGITAIALANLDTWVRSPRVVLILLFVIGFCFRETTVFHIRLREAGYTMHFGEILFVHLYGGWSIAYGSIFFLAMLNELPRRTGYQYYILMRISRRKWLCAQVLYCLYMVIGMLLLLLLLGSLFTLPAAEAGSGWSEPEYVKAGIVLSDRTFVPSYIYNAFTPLTASLTALLIMLLFWFTMVMLLLLFNLLEVPVVGVMIYAFLLFPSVTILYESFPGAIPFFPDRYYSLFVLIDLGNSGNEKQVLVKAAAGYSAIIAMLITAMAVRVKCAALGFYPANRL